MGAALALLEARGELEPMVVVVPGDHGLGLLRLRRWSDQGRGARGAQRARLAALLLRELEEREDPRATGAGAQFEGYPYYGRSRRK